jgi:flagellum-specific peptidoglycan hydrolase FlgJ
MDDREQRLREVARVAVALEAQTGCPACLLIAQWALEPGGARKPQATPTNSASKKAARHAKCCTGTTREVVNGNSVVGNPEFADCDSPEDSCRITPG